MEIETINFISYLRNEMKNKKLSIYALSKKLNVQDTTLSRMFRLETKPNLDLVIKIMKALDIKEIKI